MRRVHFSAKGMVVCGADKRWPKSIIYSTSNPMSLRITCKSCKAFLAIRQLLRQVTTINKLHSPIFLNCLLWAVHRWSKKGGYVIFRQSHWGYFPHILWSKDLKVFWSYSPLHPSHRRLPPPMFRGHIVLGS
jgi:hypothetical protein